MTATTDTRALFAQAAEHHAAGRLSAAEWAYREILKQNPNVIPAHNNLGLIFEATGALANAEKCFRNAIILKPDYPEALNNLGALLWRLHHYDEALECLNRSLDLQPDNVEALLNLAHVLQETGATEGVAEAFNRAIQINPDEYRAFWGLAQFFSDHNKLEESIAVFTRAAELRPLDMDVRCGLVSQRYSACEWTDIQADEAVLLENIRVGAPGIGPFLSISMPTKVNEQHICAKRYATKLELQREFRAFQPRGAKQKIRVGYTSCDFGEHPVAYLIADLFEHHDRTRFDVFAYSYGYNDCGPTRARIERTIDHFRDCHNRSDRETAQLIEADAIDILVDLTGYTRHARSEIFATRPAPIQVNYLGYPGTMGARCIDYIIADQTVLPTAHQEFYTEKAVYLPFCYQAASRREIWPETPTLESCGLPDDGFIFCCFNKTSKIRPAFFDIWMRLLSNAPGSVLWLLDAPEVAKANLRREAENRGVEPHRLVFAPRQPLPLHLARHRLADLFLDTLPYNAHTTMSDALWAGLPAITCMGETFAGRVGGSILQAAGLHELVTNTLEAYEDMALQLALNPTALMSVQKQLRSMLSTMPLFDTARFARDIEEAYTRMWRLHCEGRRPETIDLAVA